MDTLSGMIKAILIQMRSSDILLTLWKVAEKPFSIVIPYIRHIGKSLHNFKLFMSVKHRGQEENRKK